MRLKVKRDQLEIIGDESNWSELELAYVEDTLGLKIHQFKKELDNKPICPSCKSIKIGVDKGDCLCEDCGIKFINVRRRYDL